MKPTSLNQPAGRTGPVNAPAFLSLCKRTNVRERLTPLVAEILEAR